MLDISIFEPRRMLEVVERTPSCHTFLLDTFFKKIETSLTQKVDVDLKKGNRKLAPFVHKARGGKIIENTGYITKTYEPPLVAPSKLTTIPDILVRSAGENVYSHLSPAERAIKKMSEDFKELDEMITRREEYMAAQALVNGYINIVGDGLEEIIDFGLTNKETITDPTKMWSDHENATPLTDVGRYKKEVQIKGYVNADICILGSLALEHFLESKQVKELLDIKHMELAVINPKELPNGVTYIGHNAKDNISFYGYNEYYLDDFTDPNNPVTKPMIPENAVIVASSQANYKRVYSAVTIISEDGKGFMTVEGTRIPETYSKRNPARQFIQLNSCPLVIPVEVDSWYSAIVCDVE